MAMSQQSTLLKSRPYWDLDVTKALNSIKPGHSDIILFAIIFSVSAVCYSSLISGVVLTNHTVPNAFSYEYPSYKTLGEGRWFGDLLIKLQGGGNQSFVSVIGFAIQALNGLLFAQLLGVKSVAQRAALALIVALHPIFVDYYAFTADAAFLTFGDTLILMGALIICRSKASLYAGAAAAMLFTLALAIYQPKISLIAVILAGGLIHHLLTHPLASFKTKAITAAAAAIGGIAIYLLTAKLVIVHDDPVRGHLNGPAAMFEAALHSYRAVLEQGWRLTTNLPAIATISALFIVGGGLATAIYKSARQGITVAILTAALIICLPIAIRLSFLVNQMTWENVGRVSPGYAYAFAICAALFMQSWHRLGTVCAAGAIYGFAVIAIQENSLMQMKNMYEVSHINRVLTHIERLLPDRKTRPLVVVGKVSLTEPNRVLSFPNRPFRPNTGSPAFAAYRQPDMANFFIGYKAFRHPTRDEAASVRQDLQGRPIWPAAGSVYLLGDIVVVKLEEDGPNVPTTSAR